MLASDTTAPVGSVTSPRTEVVAVCAWAVIANDTKRNRTSEKRSAPTEVPENSKLVFFTLEVGNSYQPP